MADSNNGDRYPNWYVLQFYKKVPSSLYEKFTEVWFYFNGKSFTKKQAQETSNANWIKFSLEEKKPLVKKTRIFSQGTKTTNVIQLWVYKEC